jgi:putative transposase
MAHTFTKLVYHCIFSTKGRARLITPDIRKRLYAYIGGILREHGSTSLRAGGTEDHVHLLIELSATMQIAEAMRLVKANSSKWIRETFPIHAGFAWQTGYAAFSVSMSAVDDVARYLDGQEQHHRSRTFEQEFIEFLRRHNLEYDERYVFD